MKERLVQLMQLLGVNPTQFANQIGVQRATLQHILSGRNEASLKIVTGINQAYPSVNLQWLLYGKGQAISHDHDDNLIFPYEEMVSPEFQNLSASSDTTPYNNRPQNQTHKEAEQQEPDIPEHQNTPDSPVPANGRSIREIVVFFNDGTFKKFIPDAVI